MKVYIVRYGCYSDQGISAVFSSKKEAEKFCYVRNNVTETRCYGNFWIDERVVDEDKIIGNPVIKTYYIACIDKETGEILQDNSDDYFNQEDCIYTQDTVIEDEGDFFVIKSVISYDVAKKIAIEKYQIYTQQKLEDGE